MDSLWGSACAWRFRVRLIGAPARRQASARAWSIGQPALHKAGGFTRTRSGSLRFPGGPSRAYALLQDPGGIGWPGHSGLADAAPTPNKAKASAAHDFEATAGLQRPLSTLHERRYRRPCKTRFRLAGSAFAGRGLNPLGRGERFQSVSIHPPFQGFPDASWAHARRGFYELADLARAGKGPVSPIATEAVRRIDLVFDAERAIAGQSASARLAHRLEHVAPLVDDLHTWMTETRPKLSRHAEPAKAMDYMLTRWDRFARFLEDGRICLTNNAAERALRGTALGRKSWLFAGSDRGGERAAMMLTLIGTAKLNEVDPQAWLADVLHRIADTPMSRLPELLPWNWPPAA